MVPDSSKKFSPSMLPPCPKIRWPRHQTTMIPPAMPMNV